MAADLSGKPASAVAAWLRTVLPFGYADQPAKSVVDDDIDGDTFVDTCVDEDHESLSELGIEKQVLRFKLFLRVKGVPNGDTAGDGRRLMGLAGLSLVLVQQIILDGIRHQRQHLRALVEKEHEREVADPLLRKVRRGNELQAFHLPEVRRVTQHVNK